MNAVMTIPKELAEQLASPLRKNRDTACRQLRTMLDNAKKPEPVCSCLDDSKRHCLYCGH